LIATTEVPDLHGEIIPKASI